MRGEEGRPTRQKGAKSFVLSWTPGHGWLQHHLESNSVCLNESWATVGVLCSSVPVYMPLLARSLSLFVSIAMIFNATSDYVPVNKYDFANA